MNQPRPAFRHIHRPLDVPDEALEKFSATHGVPSLSDPTAKAPPGGQEPRQDSPSPVPRPSPSGKPKDSQAVKKSATTSISPRTALEKLTMELPGYLIDAVKRDAIERHTSARHVLMLALQGAGFEVQAADLADQRRRKTVKS